MMQSSQDSVLRALTKDGGFRVIAVSSTHTVRGAIEAQKVVGTLTRPFAELVTAAVILRETLAPDLRLQCILQAEDKRSRLVADAHPDGVTRGLKQMAEGVDELALGDGAFFQVARSLQNGTVHQGVVQVPPDKTVSSAVMAYMQESEQTVTMVAVGCHIDDAGVVASAGGYMVQLLPELKEGDLMVMTERLADFDRIEALLAAGRASPDELLAETLYMMPYEKTGQGTFHFGCTCSPARLAASLSTLPRSDIESMLAEKKPLEIECDFCGRQYQFHTEQLRGLLDSN